MGLQLAYIVGSYPQPSETFIAREIAGLRARGHRVEVFSLFAPAIPEAGVTYGWRGVGRLARKVTGIGPLARRWHDAFIAGGHDAVVAHFGSLPSTVALEAAGELPLILSLHARDIYVEAERLPEKLARAAAVVSCTRASVTYLREHFPAAAARIHLVYHGLPAEWLAAPVPARPREAGAPLRLLAVGRLVEKKGFGVLLDACARLAVPFTLRILGDGPERAPLEAAARRLGLAGQVALPGWASPAAVRDAYAWADVFCCPSLPAADGDQDGLPNVLVEAMAMGLPAVGSRFAAIPEAIEDGRCGCLVSPADPVALAETLSRLADAARRAALGAAAARRAREEFDGARWLGVLEGYIRAAVSRR